MNEIQRSLPPSERDPQTSEHVRSRLTGFQTAYEQAAKEEHRTFALQFPELPFHNEAGKSESVDIPQEAGKIVAIPETQEQGPVVVKTDCGVVCDAEREIATDKIVGCACLMIVGKQKKIMLHLTPNSSLPYLDMPRSEKSNAAYIAKYVLSEMKKNNMDPAESRAIILGNLGDVYDESKQSYKRQQQSWDTITSLLSEDGMQSAVSVELPLDRTAVYHSAERPDELAVIGYESQYDPQGNPKANIDNIHGYWIPLSHKTEFSIERPLPIREQVKMFMANLREQGVPEDEVKRRGIEYFNELNQY